MKLAFNIFLIAGAVIVAGAAVMLVILVYRYIKGMRKQGFFGGKRNSENQG